MIDDDTCYVAVQSKDTRFDGWFFTAVTTTGIYCRPSCPATTPKRTNVAFYPSAAAAQASGFRACKRCRPDASPGSPEWNGRADLVARAMRLIADGVVDRDGVGGLAGRLHYSERQLNRRLVEELGAGPLALARAQRAQTARILIETSDVPISQIAFASGFASIRQFNDTVRGVFALSPSELRSRARRSADPTTAHGAGGWLSLRLAHRMPMDATGVFEFLGARLIDGVERCDHAGYRRTLQLPYGRGVVALEPLSDHVHCSLQLDDLRDLQAAVQRCRRLLDLDSDPVAVDAALSDDPAIGPLVCKRPGLRVPGHVDPFEVAVRAIVGQQVSVAGARTVLSRLSAEHGATWEGRDDGLARLFPTPAAFAAADPATFPMPRARAETIVRLAAAVADGAISFSVGADRDDLRGSLLALRGVGPWTADYVALRGLGDPDVFLPTDLGVKHALDHLGLASDPKSAATIAERWRPWRSYALMHLWSSL